jgi:hypothetical protein
MSKIFSPPPRRVAVAGLYSGSKHNAAVADTRVFAAAQGLTKAKSDALSEALLKDVTTKLIALAAPLDLRPSELADLNRVVLAHMLDVATDKPTGGKTDHWADEALADLKSRHVSMTRVRAVIADCNAWLEKRFPQVHQALKNSKGLGNHPQIVRKLTDRFLAHESEQARAQRGSKWLGKARGTQPAAVPSGGLMAGPSGDVATTALAALDRRPLGADSDAA